MKRKLFDLDIKAGQADTYTEQGQPRPQLDGMEPEVARRVDAIGSLSYREAMLWLQTQPCEGEYGVLPLHVHTAEGLAACVMGQAMTMLYVSRPLHTVEDLDSFLAEASRQLPQGACLWCHGQTSGIQQLVIRLTRRGVAKWAALGGQYLWHRVCPKLGLTRRLYFAVTHGRRRSYSRVELLGRAVRAGFAIVGEKYHDGNLLLTLRKEAQPADDTPPTGSPVVRLRRIGLGGREIVVHKLRTMHTYAEYLQDYVYRHQHLGDHGKFHEDWRISTYGRWLRKHWIDEWPMVWDWLRGDLKLVGVRPLSRQYFSLYSPEMRELRVRVKPGLLPPFYYEAATPETLDEVQQSERRYLEAYLRHPLRTDWRYFWGIVGNILFRNKRSR